MIDDGQWVSETEPLLFKTVTFLLSVGLHQLPKRTGKVPDAEKFDASFFKITDQEANWMDPQIRIFHETTYEAFADSGNDPASFRGSNTGVYIGWCYSDTDSALKEDEAKIISYLQLASTRVSMAFGLKGVSLGVDTACASSFTAFHQALCAIRSGVCDSALVGGWAIHLRPSLAVCFHQLMMISTDGRSKCMDAGADGYCRSEAIVSVLLQRRSAAKRVYATVLNARTNTDGFKIEGITFPSIALQTKLMEETYSEAGVDPKDVDYVEAHMTGTAAGDPVESAAIAAVMCKDRNDGLFVGCLKSNMGHSEGASGLCAITKSCLAFQRRMLPPNIHFKVPNETIDSLKSGQLKPVLEKMRYDGSLIGLNCFGFGGCNVHAIIRANEKIINEQSLRITTPLLKRLITFCGRTQESIHSLQTLIERNPDHITNDFCALLYDISSVYPEKGMIYRSYFILDEERKVASNKVAKIREQKPLVFILPGLGPIEPRTNNSTLWHFPAYRSSKLRSEKLFEDLNRKYNDGRKCEPMMTFFSIVSHQIAMMDLLSDLNLVPEYVIGTSIGELSAAYQDKCLTLEQVILVVMHVGLNLENGSHSNFETYTVKGISIDVILQGKPIPDFEVIAVYSPQNLLISATASAIVTLAERIKLQNIHVDIQKITIMNKSMHSPQADPIDTQLRSALKQETSLSSIGNHERSYKWLSTSFESSEWYKCVKMDISYITRMISSRVELNQVYDYLPKDSTLIEISPFAENFSLKSALREGMGPDVNIISIHPMTSSDEILSVFGELYLTGINPNVKSLYPVVKYPVSRETASISPLLKWRHDKSYLLTRTPDFFDYVKCNQPFQIDLMEPRYQYLVGHKVDGRILFPATGYLWLVWDIFAHIRGYKGEAGKAMLNVGAEFRQVEFKRATILPKNGSVTLNVLILTSVGRFTVTEGGATCVTGYIRLCPADPSTEKLEKLIKVQEDGTEKIVLSPNDIYKDFKVRGYDYGPTFQGLQEANSDGSSGKVKWIENWVSFSDSMFQLAIFGSETRQLLLPTYIDYMKCDIRALVKEVDKISSEGGLITLTFDKVGNVGGCPGMFIRGLKASPAPRRLNQKPLIEVQSFTPYDQVFPTDVDKLKKLIKYDKLCTNLISEKFIAENWTDEQREVVLQEGKSISKSLLFSLLNEATSADHLKELLANNGDQEGVKLSEDLLLSSHDPGCMVRSQIDVILENIPCGKKMSIYEISSFNQNLHEQIKMILNSSSASFDFHSLGKDANGKTTFPAKVIDADLFLLQEQTLQFGFQNVLDSESGLIQQLQKTSEIMSTGSFMMILFRTKMWSTESLISKLLAKEQKIDSDVLQEITQVAQKTGLIKIGMKQDETTGIVSLLLRKRNDEQSDGVEMIDVKLNDYEWVEEVKEKMVIKDGEKRKKIWLLAKDSPFNGIVGLVNSLRKEGDGSNIRCLFNAETVDENNNSTDVNFSMKELLVKDLTMNVVKNGQLGSYRYQKVDDMRTRKTVEDAFLDVATKGDLSSLTYFKSKEQKSITVNATTTSGKRLQAVTMSKYRICYSALNFKDVMVASGRIPTNAYPQEAMKEGNLGMEFSGVDKNGTRVMGMTQTNAIATSIIAPDVLTWKVPDWMTLREAATIPVAYVTVYYSLLIRGRLLPGESILIHAGTGAVGQAAINLALSMGCTIFTTVGTRAKREFIRKKFPSIPEKRILNSRDVSFELEIMRQTDGRGVDVILNSLAEDKMKASFRCVAEFGRFLEIGKYDIVQNNPFGKCSVHFKSSFTHPFLYGTHSRASRFCGQQNLPCNLSCSLDA